MPLIERYGGVGATCPLFTIAVNSGGSFSSGGTLYFSFQLQNRAGMNFSAVSSAITYTAGQEIAITIPSATNQPAWDIFYYVISAGASADPSTHVNIARVANYQYGTGVNPQSVPITLPYTLTLSRDAHIALAPSVATDANLPVAPDLLDGQVRFVTADSRWLQYQADNTATVGSNIVAAATGNWVQVNQASSYVSSSVVGSDTPLIVTNANLLNPPNYPAQPFVKTLPTWQLTVWLVNSETYNFPGGSEFGMLCFLNGNSTENLMSGLVYLEFLGFANTSTGALRITTVADNTAFSDLGAFVPWSSTNPTPFVTSDDLLPGEAIALAIKPYFADGDFEFPLKDGDVFTFRPTTRQVGGDYNPMGEFLKQSNGSGGAISNQGGRYRVVPAAGSLSFSVLSGMAIVGDYSFPLKPQRNYTGLVANTSGQQIVINGSAGVYAALSSYQINVLTEAIRAIVSTVAGESAPGAWSSAIASTGDGVTLTLTYPTAISSAYPDVIAGNTQAVFNPYGVNIYLQRTDTEEIRQFTGFLVVSGTSQSFSIVDWTQGATVADGMPDPSTTFSLFAPGATTIALAGTGNFPTASYKACYTFTYNGNQITSISHASPPAIVEWNGDFYPPSLTIGTTTVLNPNQNPVVTETTEGAGSQIIANFQLPRAPALAEITATTLSPGSSATASSSTNTDGDIIITLGIPQGAMGPAGSISAAVGAIALTEVSPSSITAVAGELQIFANSSTGRLEIMDPTGTTEQVATLVEAQQWSGYQGNVVQTINANTSTTTINVALGNLFLINLSSNTTITATNITTGSFSIKITQASPGGFVVTWNTAIFKFGSGNSVVGTANGASTLISCASFDGTTLEAILAGGF